MSGGLYSKERRHMRTATGYENCRGVAAALKPQQKKAIDALEALKKNPADEELQRSAIRERDRLADLYRRLTGRELFDRPLPTAAGGPT